jgi:hypothetical protein
MDITEEYAENAHGEESSSEEESDTATSCNKQ